MQYCYSIIHSNTPQTHGGLTKAKLLNASSFCHISSNSGADIQGDETEIGIHFSE